MNNTIWWDINKTASYNALFNFIIGNRGAGKTYGSLKRAINKFIKSDEKNPSQFVYLRRMKTELKKLTTSNYGRLFDKVQQEFPTHKLAAKGDILYCDKKIMGYAIPLSTATILKSDSFPNVDTIIFDEFIIDNTKTYHYLPDEVRKFEDLYETIARPGNDPTRKDVIVWFLSNAVTINNPYFMEYHLSPPYNGKLQRFGKSKDILVESVNNIELARRKKNSRFGKIIEDTDYSDYAYDNKWLLDNNEFIENKTQRSNYYLTIRYKNNWLGIWYDQLQGLFYISQDYDSTYPIIYSATTDDHLVNTMLMKKAKQQPFLRQLISAYESGAVRYETIKIKSWFRDIMRMCW